MARKIYAGSDVCLMPSQFEPCGLSQIISMRYGTIPIVRKTGGLADTVKQFDPCKLEGNGFLFDDFTSRDMLEAIKRAKTLYQNVFLWNRIIENAMETNYSWQEIVKEYEGIYKSL